MKEILESLREGLRRSRSVRRAVKWYRGKYAADPGWGRILALEGGVWQSALNRAKGGPPVLLATSIGGYWTGTNLESLLAAALTLRGAAVRILLCDGVLPACQACDGRDVADFGTFVRQGPQKSLCGDCLRRGLRLFEGLGLPVVRFSECITDAERQKARRLALGTPAQDIGGFRLDGVPVGEHALAGALRFFARGDLDGEPHGEAVLRRYFEAAILTSFAARYIFSEGGLFSGGGLRAAVFHHGIYVPQGIIGEEARRQGLRVVNWNPAYRKRCFIFSHGDTYHHTLLEEPAAAWEDIPWGPREESEILSYLASRRTGGGDWIWFNRDPVEDPAWIAKEIGVDLSRPFIGLLTNVIWDAQLHYRASAFPRMVDWLVETVRHFAARPGLPLVIRVHPAEVRGTIPSRQTVVGELQKAFPRLPPNVHVVPPTSRVSTYALMSRANAALIYGTKTGVELAALGIPIVVAGEAWIRGKGLTIDARSPEHYGEILAGLPLPGPLGEEEVRRARKYAYHFFFRRMIPLECMEPTGGDPPFRLRLSSLADLAPGRMLGLDAILAGILDGRPFVDPVERRHGSAHAGTGSDLGRGKPGARGL